MIINQILVVFLPSFVTIYLIKKDKEIKKDNLLILYFLSILIINAVILFISFFIKKHLYVEYSDSYTFKCLLFGTFLSLPVAFILTIVEKYFKIKVTIDAKDK